MLYWHRKSILILFLLISFEYGGDPILKALPIDPSTPDLIAKILISFMAVIFMLLFGLKMPRKISLLAPFLLFMGVILSGFAHGVLSNTVTHAFNEVMPFFFCTLFLAFCSLKKPLSSLEVENGLKILVYIVFFKVLIYFVASYIVYGVPSWKILVKQSPLLMIPLSVFCSKIATKSKSRGGYNLILFLILIGVVFAYSRMLFLGAVFIFCIYFLNARITKLLPVVFMVVLSITIYLLLLGGGLSAYVDMVYGGEVYQDGLQYRLVQFDIILKRLIEFPLFGVGFGYYTPGYLTYGLLAKPYLLELDILNFISKIGLVGGVFYGVAYLLLFRLIMSIADDNVRGLSKALFVSLIALMIYSLGQTAHQGISYWIFLAFVYGFVVSHLRVQHRIKS